MAQKILVTGGAGVLGGAVARALAPLYDVSVTDMREMNLPLRQLAADLSKADQARRVCEGMDVIVHAAAIHPWKKYTSDQYLDCNVKAAYNVLAAAAEVGVKRVVYTSSIAAMGYRAASPAELPFNEDKPCRPTDDLYGLSKHVGEQFCHMFHRSHGLPWVFLRPGCFIPIDEAEPAFGLGLLGSRVSFADIAQGHFKALLSDVVHEAIILTAGAPFTAADSDALLSDARSAILKYYPEAAELEAQGLELPTRLCPTYRIDKARRLLGYEPEWTFDRWLRERLAS